MKRFVLAALALGLGAAAPAYAVETEFGANGAFGTPPGGYASTAYFEDFESATDTNTNGNGRFSSYNSTLGSVALQYSSPDGDATRYFAETSSISPVTFNTSGLSFNRVSLYWGSIDSYNSITFLGLGQTYGGSFFFGDQPNQIADRYVTFTFTAAEAALITGIQFATTSNAFEFDNLQLGTAVPEPSTWAMMMVGLGLAGGALRRRGKTSAKALANA